LKKAASGWRKAVEDSLKSKREKRMIRTQQLSVVKPE
jgi:hypothetical protein